jgi:acetoin utilization deacetylase AcuC-like enzyme
MCSGLAELAEGACGGKLVLLLEGGYDLEALAGSTRACLEVLRGRREAFPSGAGGAAPRVVAHVRAVLQAAGRKPPAT